MNAFEKELWNKLSGFSIDEAGQAFSFSDRLARDNGWTKDYALQVIEEYKKFLFLSTITTTGVTPSDPVDQAWHLHLTYTHSYWTELCGNILGKHIQHNPTKGGETEASKYLDYYEKTLAAYQEKFGARPPGNIWPDSRTRFSDIDFVRINRRTNWVISKEVVAKAFPMIALALFMILVVLYNNLPSAYQPVIIFIGIVALVVAAIQNGKNRRDKGSGTGSGCSGGCAAGHSGCSSGCSGCAASGCSGCSGGGGGD